MTQDFWDWYEDIKLELFYSAVRVENGLDPNGKDWIREGMFWTNVKKRREKCMNNEDPEQAILEAMTFDKQYFLKKNWDKLEPHKKKELLAHVWKSKGYNIVYSWDWWLPFFEETGLLFLSLYETDIPTKPIVLYRASEPFFRRGMSWTLTYSVAEEYQGAGVDVLGDRYIYGTIVKPESILAIFRGNFHTENNTRNLYGTEYVVNHQHLSFDDIYAVDDPEWEKIKQAKSLS